MFRCLFLLLVALFLFGTTYSQIKDTMHMTKDGIVLLKQFEGFRDTLYPDSRGFPTVCYGRCLYDEPMGTYPEIEERYRPSVNLDSCEKYFQEDLLKKEVLATRLLKDFHCNANQFDALLSRIYNGAYQKNGKLATALKAQMTKEEILPIWMHGYEDSWGLCHRRLDEFELYFDGDYVKSHDCYKQKGKMHCTGVGCEKFHRQ